LVEPFSLEDPRPPAGARRVPFGRRARRDARHRPGAHGAAEGAGDRAGEAFPCAEP